MNRTLQLSKLIGLGMIAVVMLIVSWPCLIAGMSLRLIFHARCPQWAISLSAFLVVLILRYIPGGTWPVRLGGQITGDWWQELMSGILSWAVSAILVNVGYQVPRFFLKGLRTSRSTTAIGSLES